MNHICIKLMNLMGFLKRTDKYPRLQKAPFGVSPPCQRFKAAYTAQKSTGNRLIIDFNPSFINCLVNMRSNILLQNIYFLHIRLVEAAEF